MGLTKHDSKATPPAPEAEGHERNRRRRPRSPRRKPSAADTDATPEVAEATDPPKAERGARRRTQSPPSAPQDELRPRPVIYEIELAEGRVDPEAARVVTRLVKGGFEAYLVGGCVRDLLIGRTPKDFDVATSARPEDVRAMFRNSRIIGRRFQLVHVLYGNKVIETATFRRNPQPNEGSSDGSLLIRYDNAFGEAHEDAVRRDFTINGLFYDLERRQVLDWVAGMPDIEQRCVHTIGEPVVRFLEDPVRILRAIKFAARLDFGMSPAVYDAIVQCRGALAMAARPRLFEELLRLMRGGACHRSLWLCWETGVLDVLLPELATYLSDCDFSGRVAWRMFHEVDRLTQERGQALDDILLCAVLLMEPLLEASAGSRDAVGAAQDFLEPVVDRLNMPRRIADAVSRLVTMLPRLEKGGTARFKRSAFASLAEDLLRLRREAHGSAASVVGAQEAPAPSVEGREPRRSRRRAPKAREQTES